MFAEPFSSNRPPPRRPSDGATVTSGEVPGRTAEVLTLALTGLDTHVVRVAAELAHGPVAFVIEGLAEHRMRETRVRVRATLDQLGIDIATGTITVRFDHPELVHGGSADAAIALAVAAVVRGLDLRALEGTAILGELSLTGAIRSIRGVTPMLRGAASHGLTRVIVSRANGNEAAYAGNIRTELAGHLHELVDHVTEGAALAAIESSRVVQAPAIPDLSDLRGMRSAARALEIAAAGAHATLMTSPPGSGQTMLARRVPGILPEPSHEELLDITAIHSVSGLLNEEHGLVLARPFRAPHHTVSAAGLVGGGDPVRPGEVSLAHGGALFLDELHEFRGSVLEQLVIALRQGHATVVRAKARVRFPARPLVVCGTTPCPCGWFGSKVRVCICPPERIASFRRRAVSLIRESLDVRITLDSRDPGEIRKAEPGEPSRHVRERVTQARAAQAERARQTGSALTNAALTAHDLERVATPDAAGATLLAEAMRRLDPTADAHARVLRVARTIADLDGQEAVTSSHLAEALTLTVEADARFAHSGAGGEHAA